MISGKSKLRYYDKAHTYWIGKKQLTSVTTWVGTFFEKFDAKRIARMLSKFPANKKLKHGMRWFLKDWKARANSGTTVHEYLEWYVNDDLPEDFYNLGTEIEKSKYEQGVRYLKTIKGDLQAELKVYDEELLLAGTIDLIETLEDGSINLIDWKTNKKLNKKGYQGKKGIKPPLTEYDDCHMTKYGLQLSTYAYILERQGYKIDHLYICHLKEDSYKLIEVGYDKGLVKKMIKEIETDKIVKIDFKEE